MYKQLFNLIFSGLQKKVPATGLGIFRICFGLVILQEVIFLFFFRQLIFDRTPYLDPASILVTCCLFLWGLTALFLSIGYYTRFAAVANYLFWLGFVCFTPMRQDFDGGFDQLMTGSSFLLMFLPTERALSIDNLRLKLKFSTINYQYVPSQHTSILSYYIPIVLSVGVLYFDAAIHKLWAEHWRNGVGAWLPSSIPYYMSAIDMTWFLNNKPFQYFVGYSLIIYQFSFVFLCYFRKFRVPLMLIGVAFHIGIITSLNIYPFGFGMLVHFVLMTPFAWWRFVRELFKLKQSVLTVFYDQYCSAHNRTVIVIQHFDFLKSVEFKSVQEYAEQYRVVDTLPDDQLSKGMYSLDQKGRLYSGLDAYIQIFLKMKYTAILGFCIKIPGIYHVGTRMYHNRADTGNQLVCDKNHATSDKPQNKTGRLEKLYRRRAGTSGKSATLVTKFLIVFFILQMNSTIRYGIFWRAGVDIQGSEIGKSLTLASDLSMLFSHLFFGISPHALYLHDHLNGYNHIFAFTYTDKSGAQKWLPFVNEEGRIIAPNWGRVQSMWANIAVRPNINQDRLYKFTEKVTAFWGTKVGLDLSDTEFSIKLKEIRVPMHWEADLRNKNLSQPWIDIGKVVWKNKTVSIDIPNIDIETL